MNWYLAKIIYQIVCGNGDHTPQFDEQLRLVGAASEEEAFSKATSIGKNEQEVFYNQRQQLVKWVFVNVSELYQLNLVDGAELFSKITEQDHADSYINLVHQKAKQIQNRSSGYAFNQVVS